MFATLLGALPEPPDEADPLTAVVRAQEEAGLEPITDGLAAWVASDGADAPVARWRRTQALTERVVKAVLVGPYTLSRTESLRRRSAGSRALQALAAAERLHDHVLALAAAGCRLVEIEETEAHVIGDDATERRLFREAHLRLAGGIAGTHLSLSIVGGSAWDAGPVTILEPPYHSLAVDLIAGPDNWYLVVRTPGDRGIVAGVIEARERSDDGPELPVWAAHYAASTGGRGLARVGLGTAGGLAHLTWPVAVAKLRRLGEAARVAGLPRGEQADKLDPRAIDIRTAAMGRGQGAAFGRVPRRRR